MAMKLPNYINVITDVFGETLEQEGLCFASPLAHTCAEASFGSWYSVAMQIVLTLGMAPSLARCRGGRRHFSLKFNFVFVPVTVLLSSIYSILTSAIPKMFLSVCQPEHAKMNIAFVGHAGHFDTVIDLAGSEGLAGTKIVNNSSQEIVSSSPLMSRLSLESSRALWIHTMKA